MTTTTTTAHLAPPVSAQTTLGVPFVPPAVISEQSTRVRNLLGRWHRRLAPPPVQILESALTLLDHRVLVALCEVGVPDALGLPMRVDELAHRLDLDAARLDRLVRYASARGWLRLDRRERVHPTKVTEFLRTDHPAGWRAWVDFVSSEYIVAAVAALGLSDDTNGFEAVNDHPFFEFLHHEPALWSTFDDAMAAGARMHALMLDSAINWRSTCTVCDVGGGTGELVRTLLDRHPDWYGTVYDLPDVIERAVGHPRMQAVPGDAFTSVPPGSELYLLVNVLHDWNDDDAERILTNVVAACGPHGRVIVVENERHVTPRDDLALRADVLMAALTNGGRERTRAEFDTLGRRAGLRLVSSTRLGSGDRGFEYRPDHPAAHLAASSDGRHP